MWRFSVPMWLAVCLTAAAGASAEKPANLIRNPDFALDADGDGVPDGWRVSGDANVVQTLSVARDEQGRPCARLQATAFKAASLASHVMLCQMDIPIERGRYYRLAFRARGEGPSDDLVQIGMRDTRDWASVGLDEAFVPTSDWKRYEFTFLAPRDCPTGSRLQFWFSSVGTLWMADAELLPAERPFQGPGMSIEPGTSANRVPNASFECGDYGWGSEARDREVHWGGSMNRLFGTLDKDRPFHGASCLRIELSPDSQPVSWFDYFELSRQAIRAPLAANLGFLKVTPGRTHTLSAYLRAETAGTPGLLAVRQFRGRDFEQAIAIGREWRRHALTFTPSAEWCYVLAGPDLRAVDRQAAPRATVWVDAVQLETSKTPTPFAPRCPIEIGLSTKKIGNVFDWEEPLEFALRVSNSDPDRPRPVDVELCLVDFGDEPIWRETVRLSPEAASSLARTIRLAPDARRRGWMRLRAEIAGDGGALPAAIRLASIPICREDDSRFGVNHAYPWPHLLDLCRKAGLIWVRDWSCKWHEIEPEPGRFTFAETDRQIDRPTAHRLKVLGLAPFPSSYWSSSAPGDYEPGGDYTKNRERISYAPRDAGQFEEYVRRTVGHYRGRVTWWQVFNEPLYTSYSLPRRFGYTGADYARWVKLFAATARKANPECRILAGIGGIAGGGMSRDWLEFVEAGGLAPIDAVDIHHYPRIRPPEFMEEMLREFNKMLDEHGGRKPIWLTEYGYYADDDPSTVPMEYSEFDIPLENERLQAAYVVRWNVIMLAGGVEKIFYHAGTCDGVNRDSLQGIFFEYGGQPHKVYAAQAVMSRLLPPGCRFAESLPLGEGVRAYRFQDSQRALLVVWVPSGARARPVELRDDRLEALDLMGRPLAGKTFTPNEYPVYVAGQGVREIVCQPSETAYRLSAGPDHP